MEMDNIIVTIRLIYVDILKLGIAQLEKNVNLLMGN